MQKDLQFTVTYGNNTFTFEQGSNAYIFHIGAYNDIDKKYDIKELLRYVSFVHECYIADDNHTPLGALADFIAVRWDKLKNKGRCDVLEKFYTQEI
jgi:hypothetical protein